MISIASGNEAKYVASLLRDAARTAGNVLGEGGGPAEAFNSYLEWSNIQARTLGPVIGSDDLDRLLTTKRHWVIQGLDVSARMSTVVEFVRLELAERQVALAEAADMIDAELRHWHAPAHEGHGAASVAAIVLDANVLLRHQHELPAFDWRSRIATGPDRTIALAIPVAVIRELDRLKRSSQKMNVYGEEKQIRSLARQALRVLDAYFERGSELTPLTPENPLKASLWIGLLLDDYDHTPLPTADAEIMDRALAFTSLVPEVWLATYDRGLYFESRRAGLMAVRLDDGE